MNIPIVARKALKISAWAFDEPFLNPGDRAFIVGYHVAHPTNPLYKVQRESDGETRAIYRHDLVDCGALEPLE